VFRDGLLAGKFKVTNKRGILNTRKFEKRRR
jgi:hypothetical protein